MLDIPVENRGYMEERTEGFEASGGCGSFVVVDQVTLGEAFCDVADFVPCNVTGIVTFAFADEFALERALTLREFGAWDKDKDVEISEAFKFVTSSSNPVFALGGLKSISPSRIISTLKNGVSVSSGKSREYLANREGRGRDLDGDG
jgi:hypothetical protein